MNKSKDNHKKRVYICHTYYHAYIASVKELVARANAPGKADIILSTMSNDFGNLKERLEKSRLFDRVFIYHEQEDTTSEEIMSYHRDRGNIVLNLLQRITYTRLLGQLQEDYIPTDLSAYGDVYVFCDSDPIGYYLNYKKIRYHAVEDGLNSGLLDDQARIANKGAWPLKKFMAKLGLIFIESGYSRYCIDYEVNDISVNHKPPKNIIEVSRKELNDRLTREDHKVLVDIFLENKDRVVAQLLGSDETARDTRKADLRIGSGASAKYNCCDIPKVTSGHIDDSNSDIRQPVRPDSLSPDPASKRPQVMILTEPLCEMDVRKKLFGDIIDMYKADNRVIIKPHPRDTLDYEKEFPDTVVIRDKFPMEVLGDIEGFAVDKVISVITQMDNTYFAKEIVYLGLDFLDKYESPEIHRKTENLDKK